MSGRNGHPKDRREKRCVVCERPFTWRRKWRQCWEDVKFCSQRCRQQKLPR
ncbi:DUF2256 domain-containing protein [Vibrio ostreicida]|uniref:DUF2256 domain-containing protein n=1 Tax=Vibrio ostreicida TaxID=526588 RepID=A0ABT8BZY5_9VIBR|nr:DUF2256 domain-containing protein [Vibrio ostreicida]MDN3611946.1 DUF2256 domain-containing protein [Vibrio ostreicida]NPD08874.1 DUF2256 domain-containing protein [Vibrio ostreicida]